MIKQIIEHIDYLLIFVCGVLLGFIVMKKLYEDNNGDLSRMAILYAQIAMFILFYIRYRLSRKSVSKNNESEWQKSHNHHSS